ncbi:transposase [Psychrobacter sp. I-STPA10]|uniref:transposase n=1 Tax=Psychrobacter sp. I-STPA10 TaxID=2585769 RepID=UPI001E5B1C32|nr:transposase [Psychrobacter sp. I-STPA10]
MTKQRSKFTREFKLEAISAVIDENRKIKEVANSLNIGISTLDNWVRKYRQEQQGIGPVKGNALTDEQRELQQLRKENKRLRMERDILKKASALLALDNLKDYR